LSVHVPDGCPAAKGIEDIPVTSDRLDLPILDRQSAGSRLSGILGAYFGMDEDLRRFIH
jgi:hypothetical protein